VAIDVYTYNTFATREEAPHEEEAIGNSVAGTEAAAAGDAGAEEGRR
jgi:hypothetical protein